MSTAVLVELGIVESAAGLDDARVDRRDHRRGLKNDPRAVRWKKVGEIVLSWVVTLPVAALIAAGRGRPNVLSDEFLEPSQAQGSHLTASNGPWRSSRRCASDMRTPSQEHEACLCVPGADYDPKFLKIHSRGNHPARLRLRRSQQVRGEGEIVLDLGSGGGKICYICARRSARADA